MLVLLLSSIAAVSGFGNPRHAVSSRPRRVAKARLEMVFMSECPLRENALNWAKESRLRAQIKGVVALFDEREKPVYVGCFDDAAFAVAALTKKHGVETIAGVRVEEFPGVDEDDFGVKLMRGLAASWLKEATEMNDGVVPVGNADGEWDEFDADSNPFLFAVIGQDGQAPSPLGADSPESDAEERLQQRRESLKTKLDQAIEDNDQATAEKLLSRLSSNLLSDDDDE